VEWDGAEWNKYSVSLFGYFKKGQNYIYIHRIITFE
jgi:hypothetical protein